MGGGFITTTKRQVMMGGTWGLAAILILVSVNAAHASAEWVTITPGLPGAGSKVIFESSSVAPGTYWLVWDMRVEGEKPWRFRAAFAGLRVRMFGAGHDPIAKEFPTSCWQTLDWQRAWIGVDVPQGRDTLVVDMAIESEESLPGRFRVRNVRLVPQSDANLRLTVRDESGAEIAARVYALTPDGSGVAPEFTYAYTQGTRCFHAASRTTALRLPPGTYTLRAYKGFEYAPAETTVEIVGERTADVELVMTKRYDWAARGWWSGDHHTHLYRHGGTLYPMMTLEDVCAIAQAEGLAFLPFQGVGRAWERLPMPEVRGRFIACATHELTRDFWGHICPVGYTGAPKAEMRLNSWPPNRLLIEEIIEGGGAVAYAHPYGPLRAGSEFASVADAGAGLIAREWPINVALGVPCTIDILAKEDARGEFALKLRDYMRLLNLGYRCGVSGSTDFHLDQGREPIGGLRTYVRAESLAWDHVARAYNEGKTFATNGPLIDLRVNELGPGDTVRLDGPGETRVSIDAASIWGIKGVELWVNGEPVKKIAAENGSVRRQLSLNIAGSGWLLAVVNGAAIPEVMSSPEGKPCVSGQYAITSPIYIEVKGRPLRPDVEAAAYFVQWCDAVLRGLEAVFGAEAASEEVQMQATALVHAARREFEARTQHK